jgi:hypothetical protein
VSRSCFTAPALPDELVDALDVGLGLQGGHFGLVVTVGAHPRRLRHDDGQNDHAERSDERQGLTPGESGPRIHPAVAHRFLVHDLGFG